MLQKHNAPYNHGNAKKDGCFLGVTGILIVLINILTFERQRSLWRQKVPGSEAAEEIYVYQYLEIFKWTFIIAVSIGLILAIFALRRFVGKKNQVTKRDKIFSGILWMLTPLFMLVLMEWITGNLATMEKSNILKNLLIFYILYLVFSLCFRRQSVAAITYCGVMTVLAMTLYYVVLLRGRPFTIFDIWGIGTAAEVAGNYSYDIPVKIGCLLLACLFVIAVEYYLQKLEFPKERWMYLIRLVGIGVFAVFMLLILKTDFMRKNGAEAIDTWSMERNYQQKGSLYTLYLECQYVNVEKPEGYSGDAAEKIAGEIKTEREDSKFVQPENLIMIMNESLADLERLGPIQTNTEILPYIHSMHENTKKGWLQVPVMGGGTADSEYEVLTGNTKQFLPAGTTAYEFYCENPEYGMVDCLKNQGYETIALHPANSANWNRSNVYQDMGFDEFISLEIWDDEMETVHDQVSDQSVYKKLEEIVSHKEKGTKLFTFAVTIQNHGGYEKPIEEEIPLVSLEYDSAYPQAETYLALINESDRAFEKLISHFETVEEPTMIVMFGDHLPGFSENFYDVLEQWEMTEAKMTELEMNELTYQTPYVLWTNYAQDSSADELMSANYFGSYILQQAGLEMPLYNRFLLSLKEKLPVIGMGAVCDRDGEWYLLDELPKEYKEAVEQYKILQYNNIMDRKHTCKEIFSLGESAAGYE